MVLLEMVITSEFAGIIDYIEQDKGLAVVLVAIHR